MVKTYLLAFWWTDGVATRGYVNHYLTCQSLTKSGIEEQEREAAQYLAQKGYKGASAVCIGATLLDGVVGD